MCEIVKKERPTIISDIKVFKEILQFVSVEQCQLMCEIFEKELLTFIKSESDLERLHYGYPSVEEQAKAVRCVLGRKLTRVAPGLLASGLFQSGNGALQDSRHFFELSLKN